MLHRLLKNLSQDQFEDLTRDAKVMTSDRVGPKLLRTTDGRCVKLFRRRHLLTSGLLFPPALRFYHAARRLARLEIPSVSVEGAYRVPALARHVVVYGELAGTTLRETILDPSRSEATLQDLARFLARLHRSGVYFRAIILATCSCARRAASPSSTFLSAGSGRGDSAPASAPVTGSLSSRKRRTQLRFNPSGSNVFSRLTSSRADSRAKYGVDF